MSFVKFFICFACLLSLASANQHAKKFFNATAHALKVYGHSYYNPLTGIPLQGRVEDTGKLPFSVSNMSFMGLPCACIDASCGCCAGLNVSVINFNRNFCANFTFNMPKLTVEVKVLMNNEEIYKTSVSANNPPPICVPLPYVPVVDFCLRLYDLTLPGNNTFHSCLDFEARLALSPLLVMHFNCIRVGNNEIIWQKPGDDDGHGNTTLLAFVTSKPSTNSTPVASSTTTTTTASSSSNTHHQQQATNVFDPVDFENADEVVSGDGIAIVGGTTLSPEDEDKIGEHRIP